ncbi:MAG: murein hydrolase activator EnvC family protein [Eubacterium sp.]
MKSKFAIKVISVILSVVFIFSAASISAYADETTAAEPQSTTASSKKTTEEAQKTLEEQRTDLEAKLKESQEKLSAFEKNSKTTEDYINALDEKIGYLNEELTLLDAEIADAQSKVAELEKQIKPLKEQLVSLQEQYNKAEEEFNKLNDDFTDTYNAYCLRLRAIYVSGSTSIIAALLTSKDISQFLSRYEMIKAVSKSDTELLKEVNAKMEKIVTQQDGLNEQKAELTKAKAELDAKQAEHAANKNTIELKQQEIAEKKVTLSEDRAESDALLAQLTAQTQMYTEFRNEDEALIAAVDAEIDDLLNGLKSPDEVTTAVSSGHTGGATTAAGSTDSSLFSKSNAALSLTYPAPGHYSVSAPFGHYSNGKPHTGMDFPCPTGSKIVAAQKGIVIKVKRLNYSYGYYVMVYHGTDAKGRKVVTLYAHNSSIIVSVGQTVKKGQQIAKSGSTGNSTGPHCHFELILDGTKTNPKNYLSK